MEACTRATPVAQPPPLPGARWSRWVRCPPGEVDAERLWLGIGLATIALGAVYVRSGWPLPGCFFHTLTGFPCPGCGSTRAVLRLSRGDLFGAWALNPLSCSILMGALFWAVYAIVVVLFRLPRWRLEAPRPPWPNRLRALLGIALLANWVWLVVDGR